MAHRIVWSSAATVDARGRPRTRILHPIWQWDGEQLIGWVATKPTPMKIAHLAASPYISLSYWAPTHDTCVADCRASWGPDDETRIMVWNLFANAPLPVGYNPTIVPEWVSPTTDAFAVIRFEPWYVRAMPGSVILGQGGRELVWHE